MAIFDNTDIGLLSFKAEAVATDTLLITCPAGKRIVIESYYLSGDDDTTAHTRSRVSLTWGLLASNSYAMIAGLDSDGMGATPFVRDTIPGLPGENLYLQFENVGAVNTPTLAGVIRYRFSA